MALRKRPLATGVAALVFSSWVAALGLGEIQLHSALNEPLDAEIQLHNLDGLTETEILAGLASASEFTRAGLEREAILSELTFSLDLSNPAVPLLRVNSKRPIREPYLDFLVDVRWPSGRLLREYILLLDLPVYTADRPARARAAAPAPVPLGQQHSAPAAPTYSENSAQSRSAAPLAAGDEYRVGSGETLWGIASRLSGSGSVQQRLAAIYQLNPHAFIGGDINLLREGEILRLPEGGQMAAAPVQPAPMPARDAGEVTPARFAAASGEESEAGEMPVGRLQLSAIDPNTTSESEPGAAAVSESGGAGGGLVRGQLQEIQDDLARTQRENHELKERLVNLEDQLATMQRLLEVRSDDMRGVQLVAGSDGVLDEGENAVQNMEQEEAPAGADASQEASVAASPPAPQAVAAPVQLQENKGWFETVSSYLVYILGALAALIVALVVVVLRKRRQDAEEDDYPVAAPVVSRKQADSARLASSPVAEQTPPWSAVSSLDDIALDQEDDLFGEPAATQAMDDAAADELAESAFDPAFDPDSTPVDAEPTVEDIELDLSEFELDDFAADLPETEAVPPASLDEALQFDDFDFLGEADEGETQLGLAQAYLDMGDQGSAREILQEVLEAGSEAHRERARELLDGLN